MFYRRRIFFLYRVWLDGKTFTHVTFLIHANHTTHTKISTHATHAKLLWTHPTQVKISTRATHTKILGTHATHATNAKIWPKPPTNPRTHLSTPPTNPRYPRHPRYLADSFKIHINLLLIGEKGKRYYVLIKDFDIFRYDHTPWKKNIIAVIAYSTAEILESHVNNCFEINGE